MSAARDPRQRPERPLPTPTRDSQPYWDGMREHRFMLQHCARLRQGAALSAAGLPALLVDGERLRGGAARRHGPYLDGLPSSRSTSSSSRPRPTSWRWSTWMRACGSMRRCAASPKPDVEDRPAREARLRTRQQGHHAAVLRRPTRRSGRKKMNRSKLLAARRRGRSVAAVAAWLKPTGRPSRSPWSVPYPPGGLNDAVARVYADKLTADLGKTVLVDNRAGAATTVASNFVAKAAPDGYTIYAGGTSLIINPTLTGQRAVRPAQELRARVADVVHAVHPAGECRLPGQEHGRADRLRESQSRASSTWRARASAPPTTWRPSCSRRDRARRSPSCPIAAARRPARTWRRAMRR